MTITKLLYYYIINMRMILKQLKSLDVETKSGERLGNVCDVVLETDGQLIVQYFVKPSIFSGKEYLVSRDQVVRFEEGKMVVDDGVGLEKDNDVKEKRVASSPEPVVMREAE